MSPERAAWTTVRARAVEPRRVHHAGIAGDANEPDRSRQTRRHFFRDCGVGLGAMALASLLDERSAVATPRLDRIRSRPSSRTSRRRPRASSSCSWPAGRASSSCSTTSRSCRSWTASRSPSRSSKGKRFAFMDTLRQGAAEAARHAAQVRAARQERRLGLGVLAAHRRASSTTSPSSAAMATDVFNHGPAKLFVNTGSPQFGRPSMGAWVTYGIGSESQDLPGFVVLQSGPRGPRGGAALLGQRLPADDLPGRAVPHRRRADPQPGQSRRASRATGSSDVHRRRPRPERRARWTRPATRRSPRASRPTRWPTACRPARRS